MGKKLWCMDLVFVSNQGVFTRHAKKDRHCIHYGGRLLVIREIRLFAVSVIKDSFRSDDWSGY